MNGSGAGGIKDLLDIIRNIESAREPEADAVLVGFEADEDFENATTRPNPTMVPTPDSGDDLHREKEEYPKANGGGNPMRMHETLVSKLTQMYEEIKGEKLNEFDVKLYQPHELEFNRGFGGSISGPKEVQAVIKTMQPADYIEYNKFVQTNPSSKATDSNAWGRIAFSHKQRDEYNFVQRYNRDNNNLSIAQWLEKGKNAIKGAVTGQPAEPVSYQSSRIGQGTISSPGVKQGDEKAFPVNESADIIRLNKILGE